MAVFILVAVAVGVALLIIGYQAGRFVGELESLDRERAVREAFRFREEEEHHHVGRR